MIGHSQLNSRKGKGLLLAGIATIFASSPALAQSASEAEDAGNLEEIVVTANKREQKVVGQFEI
jgi:outer membrane cobalamin receptor